MREGLFDRIEQQDSERVALIVTHDTGDEPVRYGTLIEAARCWAALFAARGLEQGDRVALWLPNIAAWPAIELAAAYSGVVVVPINTRWRATEIGHLLRRTRPALIIRPMAFCDVDFDGILAEAAGDGPHAPVLKLPLTDAAPPHADFAKGTARRLTADAPINLLATSGSTGQPKFAVHRQSALAIRFSAAGHRFGIEGGDLVLCALPLCGIWGLGITLATLMAGGTAVLMPVFDAEKAGATIERLAVAHVHGGDNLILAIIDALTPSALPLRSWRSCYFGAFTGRSPADVIDAVERCGPGLRAAQAYGSSEALAFVAGCGPEAPRALRELAGGPLLDSATRFRVVDPDSGEPARIGGQGEIQLAGPTVTQGYFDDCDASRAAFTQDGWFRTGDLGERASDGFHFIARMGDALRLRGTLVDPSEIEAALCLHPAVDEAHVVGAKRPNEGDVAVAFARLRPGADVAEADLRSFVASTLARYKVPERIVMDFDIPVTVSANATKVRKDILRDVAAGYLAVTPSRI